MADQKQIPPLIREVHKLQKARTGRRLLSWFLFSLLLVTTLILPVTASINPQWLTAQVTQRAQPKHLVELLVWHQIVPAAHGFSAGSAVAADASQHTPLPENSVTGNSAPLAQAISAWTVDTERFLHTRSIQPSFLALDKLWNPGHALDSAHQPWVNDCKACHSFPFVQVQDNDCKTCHSKLPEHVEHPPNKAGVMPEQACTSCHKEHNGQDSLQIQNKYFTHQACADCHADIKQMDPKAASENVEDFANKHPEFRYQVAQSSDFQKQPEHLSRMRLDPHKGLQQPTGLKFPHDVHLDDKGVKSPQGKVKMRCDSCHQLNPDGLHFAPVTMKDHCQSCHDLKFEPAVSNREVPHGSVELVLNTLREFYSYVQVNTVPVDSKPLTEPINLVRPGHDLPQVQSFVRSDGNSQSRAAHAAVSLFEKTSCVVCHEVTRLTGAGRVGTPGRDLPQWQIASVTPAHHWLVKSQFSHAKHRVAACSDCHQAKKSKAAEDVLMPSITVCRDCHAGQIPVSNKLTSDCGLCHGFHPKPLDAETVKLEKMISSARQQAGLNHD